MGLRKWVGDQVGKYERKQEEYQERRLDAISPDILKHSDLKDPGNHLEAARLDYVKAMDQKVDVEKAKAEYLEKLSAYRGKLKDVIIDVVQQTSTPDLEKKIGEGILMETVVDEACKLEDTRLNYELSKHKSEPGRGKKAAAYIGSSMERFMDWYSKVPPRKKLLFALGTGLLAAGAAGVGGSVAVAGVGAFTVLRSGMEVVGDVMAGRGVAKLAKREMGARQLDTEYAQAKEAVPVEEIIRRLNTQLENTNNELNARMEKLFAGKEGLRRQRAYAGVAGFIGGVLVAEGVRFGVKQLMQATGAGDWIKDKIFTSHEAPAPVAPAEAQPVAPVVEAPPQPIEHVDTIIGTRGSDYESKSLKDLIGEYAKQYGYDPQQEYQHAMRELQGKGQWYNLTHQGDQVGMRVGADGHREYFFRAGSQAPAYDLPHHHEAPLVAHETPTAPAPEAAHPMPPSPEVQQAVGDINHSYEDSMWPLKGTQARASLHQYWHTLFGDAPFDKNVADHMVQDLRAGHTITVNDLHDYGVATDHIDISHVAAATAGESTGGGESLAYQGPPAPEAPHAPDAPVPPPAPEAPLPPQAVDISNTTGHITAANLETVPKIPYHNLEMGEQGTIVESTTHTSDIDLSHLHSGEAKLHGLQALRATDVARLEGLPATTSTQDVVNSIQNGIESPRVMINGQELNFDDPNIPKTFKVEEWVNYLKKLIA